MSEQKKVAQDGAPSRLTGKQMLAVACVLALGLAATIGADGPVRILLAVLTVGALALVGTLPRPAPAGTGEDVHALVDGVRAIASGDAGHRVAMPHGSELKELAAAINELAGNFERVSRDLAAGGAARRGELISQYENFARRVAAGDLTARVQAEDDTFLTLASNLNEMVEGLSGMSGEVREAATELTLATTQILKIVSEHNAAASEQAASIAQTSVTVDEVIANSQQAALRAQSLATQAQSATETSNTGRAAVERIIGGMATIREKVAEVAQDILALSDRTRAIHDITETVNELADQSNMLALNATIEAAKAGEHGRGFAVVASEVRLLAEQSKAATARVREILSEIQAASDKAVLAAEEGMRVVEAGTEGAREAGAAIDRIDETVQETANVASQIAWSAQEQSVGMEQIGQAMNEVASTTHQISQGADSTEEAARSLAALGARLDQLTSRYMLGPGRLVQVPAVPVAPQPAPSPVAGADPVLPEWTEPAAPAASAAPAESGAEGDDPLAGWQDVEEISTIS